MIDGLRFTYIPYISGFNLDLEILTKIDNKCQKKKEANTITYKEEIY